MKWVGISGSWRTINQRVKNDVRYTVRKIISEGNGIVTGGALGVDYIALDEGLKLDPHADKIKIILPTSLTLYIQHYQKRAKEGMITSQQANALISQLIKLQTTNPQSLIELTQNKEVNTEIYYERNREIVKIVDELFAFWVNRSRGTQDAIAIARKKGIPVLVFEYTIS